MSGPESEKPKFKMMVLPNRGAIEVWKRAVRSRRTHFNYAVIWRDVNGWGIQLAVSDWVSAIGPNRTYIND